MTCHPPPAPRSHIVPVSQHKRLSNKLDITLHTYPGSLLCRLLTSSQVLKAYPPSLVQSKTYQGCLPGGLAPNSVILLPLVSWCFHTTTSSGPAGKSRPSLFSGFQSRLCGEQLRLLRLPQTSSCLSLPSGSFPQSHPAVTVHLYLQGFPAFSNKHRWTVELFSSLPATFFSLGLLLCLLTTQLGFIFSWAGATRCTNCSLAPVTSFISCEEDIPITRPLTPLSPQAGKNVMEDVGDRHLGDGNSLKEVIFFYLRKGCLRI